jgi:ribosome-binding protein aMBF1 (putative translation factor)
MRIHSLTAISYTDGQIDPGRRPRPGEDMRQQQQTFAQRLAALRQARGWSQNELAREAAVSQSMVARYEAGRTPAPRLEIVARLAHALGASLGDFDGIEYPAR